MASGAFSHTNFTGGEWSKLAQGQTSDPRYKTALNVCLNGYPNEEKSWVRRPGTQHAARTRGGSPAKLLGLNFTGRAPYNMEFTDGHLRMFNGPRLVTDPIGNIVTDISTASPAVMTCTIIDEWETGDEVEFMASDIVATPALAVLANRQFVATTLTSTTFALHDSVTGAPLDGATVGWQASMTLRVSRVMDFETPYTDELWRSVRAVQSDRKVLTLNKSVSPRVLDVVTLPTDEAPASFTFNEAVFKDGPYLDPVVGSVITPDATLGVVNMRLSFEAWSATRAYKRGDFVTDSGVGYKSLTDVNLNNTPASTVGTEWEVASPGQAVGPNGFTASDIGRLLRFKDSANNWSWGRITEMSNTGAVPGLLSGSVNFGPAFSAKVDRLFNDEIATPKADCAGFTYGSGFNPVVYAGKDYTANGGKAITSAILYPPSDRAFIGLNFGLITATLYGSMTMPTGASDGTVLGQTANVDANLLKPISPVIVTSTDQSTVWNYVWLRIIIYTNGFNGDFYVSEIQFFSTGGEPGAGVAVQVLGNALADTSPVTEWRLGAYSNSTGWPSCGCYHEGRLFLGGAIPNRWDASKPNDILNFEPTSPTGGTVTDANAINYTFNSAKVNPILWMKPGGDGIIFGTQLGEGQIKATQQNLPLSPTNAQAHLITEYGCADVEPVNTGLTTVFAHRFKRQVYEYLTDAYSGKFFGHSLSKFAKHLVKDGVEEMAYQQERTPIVWSRTGAKELKGMSYRRVSMFSTQEAELLGWHRHILGSGREVESVSIGPSVDGALDALAMVTNDPETGERHVELLTNSFLETDDISTAWFLDNAVVPIGAETVDVSGVTNVRFKGLHHLERKRVTVFACGLDCGDYMVEDGKIDVPYGAADGLFTYDRIVDAGKSDHGSLAVAVDGNISIPCVIGFTYTSQGQLLRPTDSEDSRWGRTGSAVGPATGKLRRQQEYTTLLVQTQGISFGTSFDKLRPANFKSPGGRVVQKDQLFNGVYNDSLDDSYSTEGMICWEISRPYPAAICSIGGFGQTQDK